MKCPKCDESLGILRNEEAKVGALYKHRCGVILVLVQAEQTFLDVRLATKEEQQ